MCSTVFKDQNGSNKLEGFVTCTLVDNGHLTKNVVNLFIDNVNMNARAETLDTTWVKHGMFYVQMHEKIGSFLEAGRLFAVGELADIVTIGVKWRDRMELRFVTRSDGVTYFEKHGQYPAFTNENIARREKEVHTRWPKYCKRLETI